MLHPRLIAVLAAILLCLLPAAADARTVTLRVEIDDPATGQPLTGTKVEITDMQGNKLGSGTTDTSGKANITVELPDGDERVLVDTDAKDAQGRRSFYVTDLSNVGPLGLGLSFIAGTGKASAGELADLAKAAVAKCDKAAYDRWVGELNREIAELEKELDSAQQAADSFARNNNLRVTDMKGALKDLKRAKEAQSKLDPSLRNNAVLDALDAYTMLLWKVGVAKGALDDARKARESVPPFPEDCKKDKVGLVPGVKTCPDGSGGLLAGALNEIFDSEIDPACDPVDRRRDTDRPKKKKRDREEHRRD